MLTMRMASIAETSSFSSVHTNNLTVGVFIPTMINALTVIDFCGYIKSYRFTFDGYVCLSTQNDILE